jgi:hypothetical protein
VRGRGLGARLRPAAAPLAGLGPGSRARPRACTRTRGPRPRGAHLVALLIDRGLQLALEADERVPLQRGVEEGLEARRLGVVLGGHGGREAALQLGARRGGLRGGGGGVRRRRAAAGGGRGRGAAAAAARRRGAVRAGGGRRAWAGRRGPRRRGAPPGG